MTESRFLHNGLIGSGCGCNSCGLADSLTADQIVGNRLELEKDVTVFVGHPGSINTEVWKAGFVTPQVYSWVEKSDGLYWVIGELQPIRYVKHDPKALEVVPDSGGAQYLKKAKESFLNTFGIDFSEFNIGNNQLLTAGLIIAGATVAIPLTTNLIRNSFDS